jgi:hypothetical protein
MSGVRRLMLSGIALTALLALVAVASRGHRPGGGSGAAAHDPPRILFEYAASVMIVLMPIAGILIFWTMAQSRRQAVLSGNRTWYRSLVLLAAMAPLLVGAFFVVRHLQPGSVPRVPTLPTQTVTSQPKKKTAAHRARPVQQSHFQWLPVLVLGSLVLGLTVTVVGSLAWRRRQGDAWAEEAALMAALDDVLADTLDDLRAERDPRKAVIRTYARMERTFAAYGVPRAESEAPLEYVARVLDRLSVSVSAVRKVTQLFARAKFSSHEIDAGMKDEAIDALAGLRAELEAPPEAAAA